MVAAEEVLERLGRLADELKLDVLRPAIAACLDRLRARDRIDVAVFGRFKAGKSSFLNHLSGRDVLPVGVVPVTTVITRLRFGTTDRAEVRFLDGAARVISLGDIGRYVSESENPANEKKVATVEVDLTSLRPWASLEFVDTPGLGSALAHNTAAAKTWLPNVGVALVAISADAPLAENDRSLLAELRRHTPRIILLLTKADLLSSEQREEVLAFVREQLCAQGSATPPVYFYSVLPAHEALADRFKQEVLLSLLRERADAALEIARHKLAMLVAQTLDYVRVALAAAKQAESARQALRGGLAEERRQFDLLREELRGLARQWSANALDESLVKLEPRQRQLQSRVATELRAQFPQWRMRLPEFLRRWREWVQVFLMRELNEVSRAEVEIFCAPLGKTRDHLTRTLQAFHDRLAAHVQGALRVTLAPREIVLEVHKPESPPIDVAFAFDAAFGTLSQALPLAPIRPLVERSLLRKSSYEVEKNLSRLAAAWRDRVAKQIDALVREAERHVADELTTLEQMLAQIHQPRSRLQKIVSELEQLRRSMDEETSVSS